MMITLPMNFKLHERSPRGMIYGKVLHEALFTVLEKNTFIPIYLDASCSKEKFCGQVQGVLLKEDRELWFSCDLYIQDMDKKELFLTPIILGKAVKIGRRHKVMKRIDEVKGMMVISKEFNERSK